MNIEHFRDQAALIAFKGLMTGVTDPDISWRVLADSAHEAGNAMAEAKITTPVPARYVRPAAEHDDAADARLFRFLIHAAGYHANRTARATANCVTLADYRAALTSLAAELGWKDA